MIYKKIFVAKNGDDTNNGSIKFPFLTIERAIKEVRSIRNQMTGDIIVYFRAGEYHPSFTTENILLENKLSGENSSFPLRVSRFFLSEKDGGVNGHRIIFSAFQSEKVTISGGVRVTNWQLYDSRKNIYRAYTGIETRHLYVNGRRAHRAKMVVEFPETTIFDPECHNNATPAYIIKGNFLDVRNINNVEFVYNSLFTFPRLCVDRREFDGVCTRIFMKQPGFYYVTHKGGTSVRFPYYIENAYEFLREEDSFYYDDSEGYIYYIPRKDENIEESEIICPEIDVLLSLKGKNKYERVCNVTFRNLHFCYTGWLRPSYANGHADTQNNHIRENGCIPDSFYRDFHPDAAVEAEFVRDIKFEGCTFSKLGITALRITKASHNNMVRGCTFTDISGSAVVIGDVGWRGDADKINVNSSDLLDLLVNNRVENCLFQNCAVEYLSAAPIAASYTVGTAICHNDIINSPYTAIHLGYGWGEVKDVCTRGVRICNNLIDTFMAKLFDGGGVYTLGATGGTETEPNVIAGNFFRYQKEAKFGALYFDEGSSNWVAEQNVFEEVPMWCHVSVISPLNHDISVKESYTDGGYYLYDAGLGQKNIYIEDAKDKELNLVDSEAIVKHAGLQKQYAYLRTDYEQIGRAYYTQTEYSVKSGEIVYPELRVRTVRGVLKHNGFNVTMNVSDAKVATQKGEGWIAVGKGECEIRATIKQGSTILFAKTIIYVDEEIDSLDVRPERAILKVGESTVVAVYAHTSAGRTFEVLDPHIWVSGAAYSEDGAIRALTGGTAIVQCEYGSVMGNAEVEIVTECTGDPFLDKVYWSNNACSSLYCDRSSITLFCDTYRGFSYYDGKPLKDIDLYFGMEFKSSFHSWLGIALRVAVKDRRPGDRGADGYLIAFSRGMVEPVRFTGGHRISLAAPKKLPDHKIGLGIPMKIRLLVSDVADGVHLLLKIGETVYIDCIDSSSDAIRKEGYFGLVVNDGEIKIFT